MSPIPKILREIRIEKALTQAQLATMVGTSPTIISEWENYRADPLLTSLERWADALGYELDLMLIREKESVK